jgi:hypothetical protein
MHSLPTSLPLKENRSLIRLYLRVLLESYNIYPSLCLILHLLLKNCVNSSTSQLSYIVGVLQYLSLTKPDIAFAFKKMCQFMHKPTLLHWQSVKRLLHYLKPTIQFGLQNHRSSCNSLQAFSDADWAGCHDDRIFIGKLCLFLGNNLISWG